ncbi:uncharacterized protein [Nicotiana sylvestris]|uniref:uncharacterized protein n=1 Tax=Nicotiana sylvestris TaxID=4096 RepID=UPI00388C70E8
MASYEALYDRRCRSLVGLFEPGEARLLGTNLVQDALDKVKVIQETLRTAQTRQKSYAERKVRDVSYMKYIGDPSHVLNFSTVQLDVDLTYYVEPVAIFEHHVRKLRSKDIASMKVQWRGQPMEEATLETEREMQSRYPQLFDASVVLNVIGLIDLGSERFS